MWTEIKNVESLSKARMWKEIFEGEGIPARIMPASNKPFGEESAPYKVYVPQDKEHLIKEVLKRL